MSAQSVLDMILCIELLIYIFLFLNYSTNNDKYMVKPSLYYNDQKIVVFDVEKKIEDQDTVFYFTPKRD